MTVALNDVPIPMQDPIARPERAQYKKANKPDPMQGLLPQSWIDWFAHLGLFLGQTPARVKSAVLPSQGASIAPTDISAASLSAGLYRLTWTVRLSQAFATSSSLTLDFGWIDNGIVQSGTGAAYGPEGDITVVATGTLLFHLDAASPVTYATTYSSLGVSPMIYDLSIIIEELLA